MRLANVNGRGSVIIDDQVVDIEQATSGSISSDPMEMTNKLNHSILSELTLDDASHELDELMLGPPVPSPGKIIAIAINYRSHAEEAKKEIPTEPHVMAKFPTCITGPYSDIPMRDLEMVDYEAELVLAIGKSGLSIPRSDAWEHIAGIMLGNDVSDRNEQFRLPLKQFSMAKSYDHFGPIGPVLVTSDGFDNPEDLNISLNVDGEQRQNARTGDFIFSVPVLIEWLSRYVTLNQGDLIFTGTPGGVGDSMEPPTYIRDGQIVEATLEGVGSLRNRFVSGDLE